MSFSYLKTSSQAQQFFQQLPAPGTLTPQAMAAYAAAAAPAAARVAVVKKKVAVATPAPLPPASPVQPAAYVAPHHVVPFAPAVPVGNPVAQAGHGLAAKAMQALHAVKGNKWYVALPVVVGLLFMCFKALAFDSVGHDIELPPITPTYALSPAGAGRAAGTATEALSVATALAAATVTVSAGAGATPSTTVTAGPLLRVASVAGAQELAGPRKPIAAAAVAGQAGSGKAPASAQAVRALGKQLAAVEQQLVVAQEQRASQAQVLAKLQEQTAIAGAFAASVAVASATPPKTTESLVALVSLPAAAPAAAHEDSPRGVELTQALAVALAMMAIAIGGPYLGQRWQRARALRTITAQRNSRAAGRSGIQAVAAASPAQPGNASATSAAATGSPGMARPSAPPVMIAAPPAVVLVAPPPAAPALPFCAPWSFGSFGLKGPVRDEMQDAYAHFVLPGGALAVVVADGVGGEPHGAQAAQLAVAAARASLLSSMRVGLPETLQAIDAAGKAIAGHATQNGIQYGLRTTLLVMLRVGSTAHYACLGDGGLFHIRGVDGVVTNLFQPQRDKAGYLLASLGPRTAGQALAGSLHLAAGDMLLSGSDGIWERTADAGALASWLLQRIGGAGGDVQAALQQSLTEFVQIQSNGRFIADDNASIGCLGTGSEPTFLRPEKTFTQPQTVKELSYA